MKYADLVDQVMDAKELSASDQHQRDGSDSLFTHGVKLKIAESYEQKHITDKQRDELLRILSI